VPNGPQAEESPSPTASKILRYNALWVLPLADRSEWHIFFLVVVP